MTSSAKFSKAQLIFNVNISTLCLWQISDTDHTSEEIAREAKGRHLIVRVRARGSRKQGVIAKEARHHQAIKAQTLGEGFQVHRLEKLSRYEAHLDRKFERTLAMLLKLTEFR